GYWLQTNPKTKITLGDGVEYGAFATTHFMLSYLAELGLDKEHALIKKAADRYLNLQQPDGDFWNQMSCLNGYNLLTFYRLGYKNDSRYKKLVEWCLNNTRPDGGYLCNMHLRRNTKKKSCYRGSAKVLLGFSMLPEYWGHPRVLELAGYFLNRNGIFNSKKTEFVNKDITKNSFPFIWRTNTWEILLALSKMRYGNDERLDAAWQVAEEKLHESGLYMLDWSPVQLPISFGRRGMVNLWISFYMLLAKKYREQN
ncbi:MAG: hypothetical protein JXA77_11695, partial [Bacteroidales bacterium]|nr:hypothetical protein [Bacteroidales bacterium]MBN2818047.1 hypothetical protein [Bacteroidales bacterium]